MKVSIFRVGMLVAWVLALAGCTTMQGGTDREAASKPVEPSSYEIGAGDTLQIHVRNNPDLSVTLPVRPDGMISVPMVQDVRAIGRTPSELAGVLEQNLTEYIRTPIVTVMVTDFVGTYGNQIRIVGQAVQPMSLPYRKGMTVLDAIIQAGGLTQFAAGNRAKLVRQRSGEESQVFPLRLSDLLNEGDISANRVLYPGDVIVIPETYL